jgi:hypothetical protein
MDRYEDLTIEEIEKLLDELVTQFHQRLIPFSTFKTIFTLLDNAKSKKRNMVLEAYHRAMSII